MIDTTNRLQDGAFQQDISLWTKEAGALLELARNAERSGVPADPRTRERASTLLKQVEGAVKELDGAASLDERGSSEGRVIRAQLDAIHREAEMACQTLKAEI